MDIKTHVSIRILLSFLILWSVFLIFWLLQINKDYIEEKEHNLIFYNHQLANTIYNSEELLLRIVKSIGDIYFSKINDQRHLDFNGDSLKSAWHSVIQTDDTFILQHYSDKGDLLQSFDTGKSNRLDKSFIAKYLSIPKAYTFFNCSDTCYFNVIKSAHPTSVHHGLLRIAMPIDSLMVYFKGISPVELIALRVLSISGNPLFIGDEYVVDTYTSISSYRKIKSNLDYVNRKGITLLGMGEENFVASYLDHNLNDQVKFIAIENVTEQSAQLYNDFWNVLFTSLLVIVVIILMLYWFLNQPLLQLRDLTKVMGLVGKGKFSQAKEKLSYHEIEKIGNEISLVYETTHDLILELERKHKELCFVADHDPLTGLFNRRRLNQELDTYLDGDYDQWALIAIDLDYFKIVNDTLGHAVGDQLLIIFSEILSKSFSSPSIISRTGGDEFLVVNPYPSMMYLKSQLDDLIRRIENTDSKKYNIEKISFSMGIALYPHDTRSIETLFVNADAAMYENKRVKKANYHFYTGHETLILLEKQRQYWDMLINDIVTNRSLHVEYHPIVSENAYDTPSFEVLARFYDPALGEYVDTEKAINFAEKSQSIIELDKVAIDLALEQAGQLAISPMLMINISNITINSPDMHRYIIDRVMHFNYPPDKLTLEITETAEIHNFEKVAQFISYLRNMGIRFALDDFGSGFSSFFYLRSLKVDYLKIDKLIIQGLLESDNNHHILASIVTLAKQLNIKLVAEGVETKEILKSLSSYNIDMYQGYYFDFPSNKIDINKTYQHLFENDNNENPSYHNVTSFQAKAKNRQ